MVGPGAWDLGLGAWESADRTEGDDAMQQKNGFRDLRVWQTGMDLLVEMYTLARQLPAEEKYGLCSQIRRAAVSIPSNIAEGYNRLQPKVHRQFLYNALGSCAELETQVEAACLLGYVDEQHTDRYVTELVRQSRMLRKLALTIDERSGTQDSAPGTW